MISFEMSLLCLVVVCMYGVMSPFSKLTFLVCMLKELLVCSLDFRLDLLSVGQKEALGACECRAGQRCDDLDKCH